MEERLDKTSRIVDRLLTYVESKNEEIEKRFTIYEEMLQRQRDEIADLRRTIEELIDEGASMTSEERVVVRKQLSYANHIVEVLEQHPKGVTRTQLENAVRKRVGAEERAYTQGGFCSGLRTALNRGVTQESDKYVLKLASCLRNK